MIFPSDGWRHWRQAWWEIRGLPNVLLLHFEALKRDMAGEIQRVARFLEIEPDAGTWPNILRHCSFDYMKAHATPSVPLGGAFWDGGAETFIHKGVNGRWRDTLSPEESRAYEEMAISRLGPDCARWLATGAAA